MMSENRHARRAAEAASRKTRVAAANARMLPLVRQVYAEVDDHNARMLAENDGPPISCKAGCSACCSIIIYGEMHEAELLIAEAPEAVRRAEPQLRRNVERWHAAIAPGDAEAATHGDPGAVDRVAGVWRDLDMPCPFLSSEGLCSVYEARPMSCRTYFVTSPAEACAVRHGAVDQLDTGTHFQAHARLFNRIANEAPEGGVDLQLATLPELLLTALDRRRKRRR
jgi:Fe-S-cluster containining protein